MLFPQREVPADIGGRTKMSECIVLCFPVFTTGINIYEVFGKLVVANYNKAVLAVTDLFEIRMLKENRNIDVKYFSAYLLNNRNRPTSAPTRYVNVNHYGFTFNDIDVSI